MTRDQRERFRDAVADDRTGPGGIARDAALGHAAATWRAAAPLNGWLDEHVEPSTLAARGRR